MAKLEFIRVKGPEWAASYVENREAGELTPEERAEIDAAIDRIEEETGARYYTIGDDAGSGIDDLLGVYCLRVEYVFARDRAAA